MITAIRQLLSRLWKAVTRLVQPVWRLVVRGASIVKGAVASFVDGVRERHAQRMDTDASYPVAIAAGSTSVFAVLAASPAIAAALGVLVAELLGITRQTTTRSRPSPYGRRPWEEDRESQRLWDRNDWDEE